ncbi:hypothetical protein AALP_AA1G230800 [Arabis alpina]|uniref:NYN domain-containing protein n=1 Tax=Arabis alpina TaxID=50452 RepID=A0A087HQ24_ARAAL|nr:hypothetical protein AALP_AA1G230800 [Arabis alpina]
MSILKPMKPHTAAQTIVLWDLEDFPLPRGYDMCWLRPSIESVVRKYDPRYEVTIFGYGEEPVAPRYHSYLEADVRYFPRKEDKGDRQTRMLLEMIQWVHRKKYFSFYGKLSLMVISKDIPPFFVPAIEELKTYGVGIFLVVPDRCVLKDHVLFNTASEIWNWGSLLQGY